MKRNGKGEIALRANELKDKINIKKLTIGDALYIKQVLGLSNDEAKRIFLGGQNENISV